MALILPKQIKGLVSALSKLDTIESGADVTHIRHGVEFVHEATDVSVSLNKQIAGSYTVQVQAWDADGNNYPTANITVIGKTATEVTVRGVEGPFVETHVSVIAIPA